MENTNQAPVTPAAPAAPAAPAQPAAPITIPATPAAPAAPATPATPEAKPAAAPAPAAAEEGVFGAAQTYQPTGNSNLDAALKWAGSIGLDIDTSPEMQQAAKGNFGPLRAVLAAKGVPGAEAYITLAEAGYKEAVAAMQERQKAVQAMVVQTAGGEQEWADAFNWASENATQAEKDEVNAAFEKGGFIAEAAAFLLVHNYRLQAGVSTPAAIPVNVNAAARPATTQHGPLSPVEYGRAVQKLRASLGGRQIEGTREYAALQQRRQMYRG